jgi:hypothetical protein
VLAREGLEKSPRYIDLVGECAQSDQSKTSACLYMAELKTKPNDQSVEDFIDGIADEEKRADSLVLIDLMKDITKAEPEIFGNYHYKYVSGREGNWFVAGFSPRKQPLTLYIMAGFSRFDEILEKLGKYTTGKSCLYIKKLDDVDLPALRELIEASVAHVSGAEA